ncbi:hypothetical protein RDI58_029313 [Solanum bulbocastanum]|uniref:Uncharacterized protein n=1 Tax=Solanum bulbocastanum TaxID=147425 RepID=A0AAN8SQ49_SOLBU
MFDSLLFSLSSLKLDLYDRDDKVKIYGKDFIGWLRFKESNDAMWEHVYSRVGKSSVKSPMMLVRDSQDLLEEFKQLLLVEEMKANVVVFSAGLKLEPFIPSKTTKDEWYSLRLFSYVATPVLNSSKIHYFWRIQHVPVDIFEESEQHSHSVVKTINRN